MEAVKLAFGVYDLIERELKARITEEVNPVTSTVGTSVTQILREDPNRIAVVIINLGTNSLYIGFDREVSSSRGILLSANGGSYTAFWKEDFTLCARAMYAIAPAGAVNVYVLALKIYRSLE